MTKRLPLSAIPEAVMPPPLREPRPLFNNPFDWDPSIPEPMPVDGRLYMKPLLFCRECGVQFKGFVKNLATNELICNCSCGRQVTVSDLLLNSWRDIPQVEI